MAKMIPDRYDESTRSYAEQDLFFRFQNHLEDDWTVLHSLPWLDDSPHRLLNRECDFLLLHPKYGLLVVETKSGAPRYDGKRDEWHYDDGSKVTDPFKQAQDALYNLTGRLKKSAVWQEAELPFGYAVAFPDTRSVLGALRPDLDISLFILEPDLEQLQQKIIRVLTRFKRPAAKSYPQAIESALEILRPSFHLVPALSTTIESVRRELVRLTSDQAFALEGMAGNPRLVVHGGAGTGKTLLIVAEAQRRASEGKNVLVLCFNRPLGQFLRDQFTDVSEQVTAMTFHEFCLAVIKETGTVPPLSGGDDYWGSLFETAFGALEDTNLSYDAVLVDEGQDFKAEWWLMIEDVLVNTETSSFHIFSDEQQNLYDRSGRLPFTQPEYVLRRNCRNTGPISAFTQQAIGLGMGDHCKSLPAGPAPTVHLVSTPQEEWDSVRRVLHELVVVKGTNPDEIAILGCHKLENSCFAIKRKMGNLTMREATEPAAANTVRYSTIHKFKGLEADCILLTGIGEPSRYYQGEHWLRFLYVGGSRARVVLHVFAREGIVPA